MKVTKIEVGTNMLRKAAKDLMLRGEISASQYHEIDRRNSKLPEIKRNNKIWLK